MATFLKDPAALLDYGWDWSGWLDNDEILTSEWIVSGVTVDHAENTATATTVWVTGGVIGRTATLTNRIVTAGGRTEERTHTLNIRNR